MISYQFAEIHVINSHNFAFIPKLGLFFVLAKFNGRESWTRQSKLDGITPNFSLMRHRCFGLMFYKNHSFRKGRVFGMYLHKIKSYLKYHFPVIFLDFSPGFFEHNRRINYRFFCKFLPLNF